MSFITHFYAKKFAYIKKKQYLCIVFKTHKDMTDYLLKECEQLMIDFAKEKNMSPDDMISKFQMALLNIAGWICKCYKYTDDEYEAFMREYADNVTKAIDRGLRKE